MAKPKIQQYPPAPIINFVEFIKSQPTYIFQYYEHMKCEIPDAEVYKTMKAPTLIIMITDKGEKIFKGSLGFVNINSES